MLSRTLTGAEMRALEPWQAAEFAAYTDAHRDELADTIPWAETVVDEPTARSFLQRYADGAARDERRLYGLYVDGELVGGTLFRVVRPGLLDLRDRRVAERGGRAAAGWSRRRCGR